MRHGFVAAMAAVTLAVAAWLGAARVARQAAPAEAGQAAGTPSAGAGWTVPRTPWGDPDLRGIYNYATSTPLERPEELAGVSRLSPEELAEWEEARARRINRDIVHENAPDVVGNYNEVWMDSNRLKVVPDGRTSLIIDPPDGRLPPRVVPSPERARKAEARAASERRFVEEGIVHTTLDASLTVRCLTRAGKSGGGQPYLSGIYSNVTQIFQTPDHVVLYAELVNTARIIPLDGRPHADAKLGLWFGDARGRWEGDTLVVETTNFRPDSGFGCGPGGCNVVFGDANPETFTIVERFTRVADDTVNYEFTISDPLTWERPFTASMPFNRTDEQIYEYACFERNRDMHQFLSLASIQKGRGSDGR